MSKIEVDEIVNQTGDNDSGVDLTTNDEVKVKIAGSDVMTIKATASHGTGLGIGTSAPLRQLHIENTSANSEIAFTAGTSGVSSILFGDGQTGTDIYRGYIQYNHASDKLLFGTSSNERMNITSVGYLNVPGVYANTTSNSANVACHYVTGDITRSTSSRRYKNTIKDTDVGLAELNKLRTVSFKGNNDGDIIFNGLIAEEVHDVGLTQFVEYDDENRPDGLRYPHMISLCIKAIQELSAKVETLEAKVTALESK
tara:strand:+ start:839 stop:1603 length:765 start_codon:yes stop_codon:yes gene_type:complete